MAKAAANARDSGDETPPDMQGSPLLKPIIRELLTSDSHEDGVDVVLLVDKVNITSFVRSGERKETIRLWLSDGLMSIQCLLKQDAHHLVTTGAVRQGTLVAVDDYQLLQQPKLNGSGSVWVLLASGLRAVAGEDRGSPVYDREHWDTPQRSPGKFFREYGRRLVANERQGNLQQPRNETPTISPPRELDAESVDLIATPGARDEKATSPTPTSKRKAGSISGSQPLLPVDRNVPTTPNVSGWGRGSRKRVCLWDESPQKFLQIQSEKLYALLEPLQPKSDESEVDKSTAAGAEHERSASPAWEAFGSNRQSPFKEEPHDFNNDTNGFNTTGPLPKANPEKKPQTPRTSLKPITRPLKITPLSKVTGIHASRNRIFDFLIIISHVNPRILIRKNFPNSRELLVMDCSTKKQVHLTVFVDARNFYPEQGTVALLRNITTHEYGGGSLKAYYQRCVGTQWYMPETPGWEWEAESDKLRAFWLDCDEARTIPDGTWWTERGQAKLHQT